MTSTNLMPNLRKQNFHHRTYGYVSAGKGVVFFSFTKRPLQVKRKAKSSSECLKVIP